MHFAVPVRNVLVDMHGDTICQLATHFKQSTDKRLCSCSVQELICASRKDVPCVSVRKSTVVLVAKHKAVKSYREITSTRF
jgi:hypothetical protein